MSPIIIIILIIIFTGLIGGLISFLKQDHLNIRYFFLNILYGIAASSIVPLFLNTISSNIINETLQNSNSSLYLILVGFCLIASLSSSFFIESLTKKFINELHKNTEETEIVKTDIRSIEEKMVETNPDVKADIRLIKLTNNDYIKILDSLYFTKYIARTVNGIANEKNLDKDYVYKALFELKDLDYVENKKYKNEEMWKLSEKGKNIYK